MVLVSGIEVHQQIPERYALPLNSLIKTDQATARDRLGSDQLPTTRVPFQFREIQYILEYAVGAISPPTFNNRLNLYNTNFQLIRHPHASSLLWVGNPDVGQEEILPVEQATVTIEIEREKISRNNYYAPSYLRIATFGPELKRPIGIAWSLIVDKPISQIDIAPALAEFPIRAAAVGGPEASVERIPTDIVSYDRTFSAALITEAMIPKTDGQSDFRGVLKFKGYELDASDLAPYGFYLVEDSSDVIVGFQGGDNRFLKQMDDRDRLPRPLPSWHIAIPSRLQNA